MHEIGTAAARGSCGKVINTVANEGTLARARWIATQALSVTVTVLGNQKSVSVIKGHSIR